MQAVSHLELPVDFGELGLQLFDEGNFLGDGIVDLFELGLELSFGLGGGLVNLGAWLNGVGGGLDNWLGRVALQDFVLKHLLDEGDLENIFVHDGDHTLLLGKCATFICVCCFESSESGLFIALLDFLCLQHLVPNFVETQDSILVGVTSLEQLHDVVSLVDFLDTHKVSDVLLVGGEPLFVVLWRSL